MLRIAKVIVALVLLSGAALSCEAGGICDDARSRVPEMTVVANAVGKSLHATGANFPSDEKRRAHIMGVVILYQAGRYGAGGNQSCMATVAALVVR